MLDTSGFPSSVPQGVYTVSVTVAPKNNYHVFLGVGDLPNSRENAPAESPEDFYWNYDLFGSGIDAPPNRTVRGRERGTASDHLGAASLDGLPVDGALRASYFNGQYNTSSTVGWDSSNGDMHLADIGRTFSSPLVFKGEPVTFSTTIQVTSSVDRDQFSKALIHGLCGLHPNSSPIGGSGTQIAPTSPHQTTLRKLLMI